MWPLASSTTLGPMPPFVILGNPDSRRVSWFQAALAGLRLPPAQLVSYADLIAGRTTLREVVQPGTIVRIESPGKDWEVERALLALGADAASGKEFEWLDHEQINQLRFERGRILPLRQWYLGWCELLKRIEQQLAHCSPHHLMNHPHDISTLR